MKKISTLALGLALLAGSAVTAKAQITVPKVSDDTNTYLYYLQNAGQNEGYYVTTTVGDNNVVKYATGKTISKLQVKLVASGTDSKYNIVATNLGDDVETTYIGVAGTSSESSVTYYTEAAKQNAEWSVTATTHSSAKGYYPLYNIALNSSLGWNMLKGTSGSTVALYANTDQGNGWNFIPANASTLKALAADVKADVEETTTSASKDAINTAITNAESATDDNFETLGAALLTAYGQFLYAQKTTPSLVEGKAYTITSVNPEGTARAYYNYTSGTGYTLVVTSDTDNSNYPESAKLICRKVDGKYTFVNNEGKFFVFHGSSSSNTGYVDSYTDSEILVVENAASALTSNLSQGWSLGTPTDTKLAWMKRSSDNRTFVINWTNTTSPIFDQAFSPFYGTNSSSKIFSSAVLIEEVANNNSVTPKEATGIEGASYIATFSAPYAAVVPEGATAYYVEGIDDTTAKLTAIESGLSIPANTGVLLTASSNEQLNVAPATTETAATITNNQLVATGGSSKTLTDGDNAYILALKGSQVAFYKGQIGSTLASYKAYLPVTTEASSILMNFNGSTTGISTVQNDAAAKAPVYDLTGRRVNKAVKGSLYIQGGRKFIAK